MALVQKLNVVLTVADDVVDTYLSKGYNIIDEQGRVIQEAMPDDPNQLKLMVAKYKKEIEELKMQIVELKAKKEPEQKAEVVEKPTEVVNSNPTAKVEVVQKERPQNIQQKQHKKSSHKR